MLVKQLIILIRGEIAMVKLASAPDQEGIRAGAQPAELLKKPGS